MKLHNIFYLFSAFWIAFALVVLIFQRTPIDVYLIHGTIIGCTAVILERLDKRDDV